MRRPLGHAANLGENGAQRRGGEVVVVDQLEHAAMFRR
jgi:hypothetical protein